MLKMVDLKSLNYVALKNLDTFNLNPNPNNS